jgi:hypothetical protein
MKPLSETQRDLALHRITLALGWDMLSNYNREVAARAAKVVLAELERGAVHGASEKRALEILCQQEGPA